MREKAEERQNTYYTDVSNLTVNQDYSTRMKFTEDGRHLDNFPSGVKSNTGNNT